MRAAANDGKLFVPLDFRTSVGKTFSMTHMALKAQLPTVSAYQVAQFGRNNSSYPRRTLLRRPACVRTSRSPAIATPDGPEVADFNRELNGPEELWSFMMKPITMLFATKTHNFRRHLILKPPIFHRAIFQVIFDPPRSYRGALQARPPDLAGFFPERGCGTAYRSSRRSQTFSAKACFYPDCYQRTRLATPGPIGRISDLFSEKGGHHRCSSALLICPERQNVL